MSAKFENTWTGNWMGAVRGARNPLESWKRSDSRVVTNIYDPQYAEASKKNTENVLIGENDMKLMKKLIRAGSSDRKFLRQIFVSVDITAPVYWWSEAETYKVGITENSTSLMHKGASKNYARDNFTIEEAGAGFKEFFDETIEEVNRLEGLYKETGDMKYFRAMRQIMPMGFNYTKTWSGSYENVLNMYRQRVIIPHRLTEWKVDFAAWAESLPYFRELFLD